LAGLADVVIGDWCWTLRRALPVSAADWRLLSAKSRRSVGLFSWSQPFSTRYKRQHNEGNRDPGERGLVSGDADCEEGESKDEKYRRITADRILFCHAMIIYEFRRFMFRLNRKTLILRNIVII